MGPACCDQAPWPRGEALCPPLTPAASWAWAAPSSLLECSSSSIKASAWGFPGGAVVENLPASAGDTGSSPGPGRSHMLRSN